MQNKCHRQGAGELGAGQVQVWCAHWGFPGHSLGRDLTELGLYPCRMYHRLEKKESFCKDCPVRPPARVKKQNKEKKRRWKLESQNRLA